MAKSPKKQQRTITLLADDDTGIRLFEKSAWLVGHGPPSLSVCVCIGQESGEDGKEAAPPTVDTDIPPPAALVGASLWRVWRRTCVVVLLTYVVALVCAEVERPRFRIVEGAVQQFTLSSDAVCA